MSAYATKVAELNTRYKDAVNMRAKMDETEEKISTLKKEYVTMLEAQQLLATVADDNANAVLDYMTGVINKTLQEIFPYDTRYVSLEKKMYHGQHAHINLTLSSSTGKKRDIMLQSGTGLRQVISFLFVLTTIELRKGRRLLIMDELLNGLHPEAKRIVFEIIQIFAEEGFQFVFVEYGVDNVGKIYLVEKPDTEAFINPLVGKYENEVFIFNRPAEEVDKSIFVSEED